MPSRYQLVWCDPESVTSGPHAAVIGDWFRRGRPGIVRRRQPCDPVNTISLAVTLPNALGRRRLAFSIPLHGMLRMRPPPDLASALRAAPDLWSGGWPPGLLRSAWVHGGLMWQHLTGEVYLRPTSDLDLVLPISNIDGLNQIMRQLPAIVSRTQPRVDGELLFPRGDTVAWREFLAGAPKVLVKRENGVSLMARADLIRQLSAEVRHDASALV